MRSRSSLYRIVLLLAAIPVLTSLSAAFGGQSQTARFTDVSGRAAPNFYHTNGASSRRFMPETMGAGGLFWDFDNDGWLDVFLVDSGSVASKEDQRRARSRVFRNRGDGTFKDVTAKSGIEVSGYGMGACAADYDNDGWVDLHVTSWGANQLFHNNGDGTFTDVSSEAGIGDPSWGMSCAFADTDLDGDVDLYVVNYVDFSRKNNKFCGDAGNGVTAYCHPNVYNGVPDIFYRNNGDGTFTDATREVGLYTDTGKGLGVAIGDVDNDGWPDIYVANDSVPNFLFQNQQDGTFKEVGRWVGVEVNADGRPEAGMGTDIGDFDNDGRLDIFVTNLDIETNTLYRNSEEGLFGDVTASTGQADPSVPYVGFGTAFLDYDNDGDLDLAVANGNILDNAAYFRENATYAQRNLLFENRGDGAFAKIDFPEDSDFALEKVSRGLACGDFDNDGDLDLLITNNGDTADLLRNDNGNQRNSILLKLVGVKANRSAIGARVRITAGGHTQIKEVRAGSSYLSQNDLRLHFGLGGAEAADRIEVLWPGGEIELLEEVRANQIVTVVEGKGITARQPFRSPAE